MLDFFSLSADQALLNGRKLLWHLSEFTYKVSGCRSQDLWFSRFGVEPEHFHFQQVPRWFGCCFGDPSLRTAAMDWLHSEIGGKLHYKHSEYNFSIRVKRKWKSGFSSYGLILTFIPEHPSYTGPSFLRVLNGSVPTVPFPTLPKWVAGTYSSQE